MKAGAKFDDLAKQYSGGPTAAQGGDLGLFKRGALAKVLEDQTFELKAGEIDGADPHAAGICDPEGDGASGARAFRR